MKKLAIVLLALLFCVVGLSEQVTLRMIQVFTSPLRTKVLEDIISKFEAQNPGVKIELISPPYETAYQKIYLMVSAEEPLDIVEVGDWSLSALASMGKLLSLEPYLAKSELTKYLVPGVLEAARTYKGTAYLLPNAIYVKTLFYRPDVISKYGITPPARTMDELLEHCRQLTKPEIGQFGFRLQRQRLSHSVHRHRDDLVLRRHRSQLHVPQEGWQSSSLKIPGRSKA